MTVRMRKTVFTRSFQVIMLIAVAASGIFPASASFHTFRVNELYSNASGSVQFIELLEAFGANGQQFLSGHTLRVTQGSTVHTFTFPNDLPSGTTAGKHVLIATSAFAALGIVTPDYIVPAGFLFTNGATVDYAGVDSVTYGALPVDGVSSLDRNGTTGVNSPTNFAGQSGSISAPPPPSEPLAVPTLGNGAIVALCILVLVMALRRRARDGR
jgi:hypothetical protein